MHNDTNASFLRIAFPLLNSVNLWKTLPTDVKIAKTYFTYKKLFKDYCTGKYNL